MLHSTQALIAPVINTPSIDTFGADESSFLYPGRFLWTLPSAHIQDLILSSLFLDMNIREAIASCICCGVILSWSIGTYLGPYITDLLKFLQNWLCGLVSKLIDSSMQTKLQDHNYPPYASFNHLLGYLCWRFGGHIHMHYALYICPYQFLWGCK